MKAKFAIFTNIILMLLILSGCSGISDGIRRVASDVVAPANGQVLYVYPKTTLYYIEKVLQGNFGEIYRNGSSYVLTWRFADGNAFVGVNSAAKVAEVVKGEVMRGGNLVGVKDGQELIEWLKANGWKPVSALEAAHDLGFIFRIAQSLTTTLVLPTGVFSCSSDLIPEELLPASCFAGGT